MRRKIKNIAFDLGGVVIALSYENAVASFERIGLKDARQHLDAFHQQGIFGQLEDGSIDQETFRKALSQLIGRDVTTNDCYEAWHGYVEDVPKRNLEALEALRAKGYKVCLLSNTNPYMMQWARSSEFDGQGNALDHYFDALYLSYECGVMKPHKQIFEMMLEGQEALPEETLFIDDSPANVAAAEALGIHTLCPQNNEDWTGTLKDMLF
jgi:putative hydrolase of the HAD superfamily